MCKLSCKIVYYRFVSSQADIYAKPLLPKIDKPGLHTMFKNTLWIGHRTDPRSFKDMTEKLMDVLKSLKIYEQSIWLMAGKSPYSVNGKIDEVLEKLEGIVNTDVQKVISRFMNLNEDYQFSFGSVRDVLKYSLVKLQSLSLGYYAFSRQGGDKFDQWANKMRDITTNAIHYTNFILNTEGIAIQNMITQLQSPRLIPTSYYPRTKPTTCKDNLQAMLSYLRELMSALDANLAGNKPGSEDSLSNVIGEINKAHLTVLKCLDLCKIEVTKLANWIDREKQPQNPVQRKDQEIPKIRIEETLNDLSEKRAMWQATMEAFEKGERKHELYRDIIDEINSPNKNKLTTIHLVRRVKEVIQVSFFDKLKEKVQWTEADNIMKYLELFQLLAKIEPFYNASTLNIMEVVKSLTIWQSPKFDTGKKLENMYSDSETDHLFSRTNSYEQMVEQKALEALLRSIFGNVAMSLMDIIKRGEHKLAGFASDVQSKTEILQDDMNEKLMASAINERFVR